MYYSQFTFQVADYVAVMISPTKMGITEYTKVNPERYQNLKKFFLEEDNKGRVSLETFGVNYVHLLKCREAQGLYLDIYAEELNIPDVENLRKERKKENFPFVTATPVFSTPVFEAPINLSAFEPSFNSLQNPDDNPF
ncbi:MAG: hypothetical protein WBO07_06755 [Formosimonas sp.]